MNNSFAAQHPELVCEWSERNLPLTPDRIIYETIIRQNISTTRARDFYDLHTLYRSRKSEVCIDVFRAAVLHTAQKRESLEDIKDRKTGLFAYVFNSI